MYLGGPHLSLHGFFFRQHKTLDKKSFIQTLLKRKKKHTIVTLVQRRTEYYLI